MVDLSPFAVRFHDVACRFQERNRDVNLVRAELRLISADAGQTILDAALSRSRDLPPKRPTSWLDLARWHSRTTASEQAAKSAIEVAGDDYPLLFDCLFHAATPNLVKAIELHVARSGFDTEAPFLVEFLRAFKKASRLAPNQRGRCPRFGRQYAGTLLSLIHPVIRRGRLQLDARAKRPIREHFKIFSTEPLYSDCSSTENASWSKTSAITVTGIVEHMIRRQERRSQMDSVASGPFLKRHVFLEYVVERSKRSLPASFAVLGRWWLFPFETRNEDPARTESATAIELIREPVEPPEALASLSHIYSDFCARTARKAREGKRETSTRKREAARQTQLHERERLESGRSRTRDARVSTAKRSDRQSASSSEIPAQRCAHSSDFSSVVWLGMNYQLPRRQQALVIKLLWENWENGTPTVSSAAIQEAIDSHASVFRLREVFRDQKNGKLNPAFHALIRSAGKGLFELAYPARATGERPETR